MILLQSMEKYDELIEFDPISGVKRKISKKVQPDYSGRAIQGSFSELGDHLIFLFRIDDNLHLIIDNKEVTLPVYIKVIRFEDISDGTISLKIIDNISNKVVSELKYQKPNIYPPLNLDPTPFIDEEDFDYGLFLSNVLNDINRRNRIYR